MKIEEAISILDAVIPPPNHRTVDYDHLNIAIAWATIRDKLTNDVQEVKRAHFKGEERTAIFNYCQCSHCNEYTPMGYYCYFCGAKMDEK